jgi:hypothetical protein
VDIERGRILDDEEPAVRSSLSAGLVADVDSMALERWLKLVMEGEGRGGGGAC